MTVAKRSMLQPGRFLVRVPVHRLGDSHMRSMEEPNELMLMMKKNIIATEHGTRGLY